MKNELYKYRMGDKEVRHFILVKWGLICFVIAMTGFALSYYLHMNKIAYLLMAVSIIAGNVIGIIAFFNFFSREPAPEEKYKRKKQPWE